MPKKTGTPESLDAMMGRHDFERKTWNKARALSASRDIEWSERELDRKKLTPRERKAHSAERIFDADLARKTPKFQRRKHKRRAVDRRKK